MNRFLPGNRIILLSNGDQYFPALIGAIDAARETVWFETYIFADDATGRLVAGALIRMSFALRHKALAYGQPVPWRYAVIGTLLIGTILNAMTILDVSYYGQNFIKGVILLVAILADSIINPRNEETAQQGDI